MTKTHLIALVAILLAAGSTFGAYSGGTGEPNSPYQIATKQDLLDLAANTGDYGKCFILTADIDMQGQVFTTAIIAGTSSTSAFQGTAFTGTFDGNGHKITGFTINGGSNSYLGLFGFIDSGGSVKNLCVENCSVSSSSGSYWIGGLVGLNFGIISNCYSTGTVSCGSGSQFIGGLVGEGSGISNCYSASQVSSGSNSQYVGGLVGWSVGDIRNCYSTGSVSSGSWSVGGLVGCQYYGSISNCYSTGTVSGASDAGCVGGLVGYLFYGNISDCYSTGVVSGSSYIGGLVGLNYGSVSGSFWDIQTSGKTTSDGGMGMTTAQMKTLSTFTSAGWDFDTIWNIVGNVTYPFLRVYGGEKTLPEKAVELAKEVIGAPYLGDGETWGGKGYDYSSKQFIEPDKVKIMGYSYWNNNTCVKKVTNECHSCAGGNCEIGTDGAIGLDCSGLIYWSYNRAYFQSNHPGSAPRPFAYEGVSGQYSNYHINAPVSESDLHAGDLLFTEGHVMMYTGPFTYESKTYNVIHASYCRKQVVPATYDFATKKVITEGCPNINITGYGRWREQTVVTINAKCPIDLVVTDPDGFTVSKDTPEIPGLLYFSVYDIDENGRPDEMVTIPKRKVGTYIITVIPESNALPTDTYSLEATINGQTMVLAQDVQIQNIPSDPYIIESKLNPADFDKDGGVNFYDYAAFASRWMSADCHYPDWCEGKDLDYSGLVDFMDLSIFTENWLWEKIPADFDIDGDVDFVDYAVFTNHWMYQNCVEPNWCDGTDFDHSGSVDIFDLAEFAKYWLSGS